MGVILQSLVKKTFIKIFKNLSKEMSVDIENIQLGISLENGGVSYEVYKNFIKEKDILLEDYVGTVIDFTGGTQAISTIVQQSFMGYSEELKCDTKCINIIMQNCDKNLPKAVLLKDNKKIRNIDIQKEFLI